MNILYIDLKHGIRRFRICNYFCEILKFRNFMNALMILRNLLLSDQTRPQDKADSFSTSLLRTMVCSKQAQKLERNNTDVSRVQHSHR